jgi:hypothetical protein
VGLKVDVIITHLFVVYYVEVASAVYIILDGEVEISRMLNPEDYSLAVNMMNDKHPEATKGSGCCNADTTKDTHHPCSWDGPEVDTISEEDGEDSTDSGGDAPRSSSNAAFINASISPLTVCTSAGPALPVKPASTVAGAQPSHKAKKVVKLPAFSPCGVHGRLSPLTGSGGATAGHMGDGGSDSGATRGSRGSRQSSEITATTWKKSCCYSLYITTLRPGDVFGEECIIEYLASQHLRRAGAPPTGVAEGPLDYKSSVDRMAQSQCLDREYYHDVVAVKAQIAKEERRRQAAYMRSSGGVSGGSAEVGGDSADELLVAADILGVDGEIDPLRTEARRGLAAFTRSNSHPGELKRQVSLHDAGLLDEKKDKRESAPASSLGACSKPAVLVEADRRQLELELDDTEAFFELREKSRRLQADGQVGELLDSAAVVDADSVHFSDYSATSLTDKLRVVVMNKQEAAVYFQVTPLSLARIVHAVS